MEEKIAVWAVAALIAVFAASMIYTVTSQVIDDGTIRNAAEIGTALIAVGMAFASFRN